MKILITGINGLVGNSLFKLLQNSDHKLFFSSRNLDGLANYKVDISNKGEVNDFFMSQKPDIVINCAGRNDIDFLENNPEEARSINSISPGIIAKKCQQNNSKLIHISTDSVFDGENGMYSENDLPNPKNVYAKTKLEGEKRVINQCTYLTFCSVFKIVLTRQIGFLRL